MATDLFEGLKVLDEWENPRKGRRGMVVITHVNGKVTSNTPSEVEPEKVGFTGKPLSEPAKPVAAAVREARIKPAVTETLTCQRCGNEFERVVVRGRKPTKCGECA